MNLKRHFSIYLIAAVSLIAVSASAHVKDKQSQAPSHGRFTTSAVADSGVPNTMYLRQGFDLSMYVTNFGFFGKTGAPYMNLPPDSIGCEYPAGSDIEHMTGGGIWVGGILDTSTTSTPSLATLVTTGYQGWAGPLFEMFPSDNPGDHIWVTSKGSPKPAGWNAYWQGSVPFDPVSDQDFYCTYTDTFKTNFTGFHPMHIKVIQESYAWVGGYADAILPMNYRVINMGTKTINQAYFGVFCDTDVGPFYIVDPPYNHNFYQVNYTGYFPNLRTAYTMNPVDRGSTPIGMTLCATPKPLDSLTYGFRWFSGPETPPDPISEYQWLSSGVVMPSQSVNDLNDTRFLFSFGPFTIRPKDTLDIATAVVSGNSIDQLKQNASRALTLYQRHYVVPITPPSPPLKITYGFKKVTLNWKWEPGDPGVNPETVVDDSNKLAMNDPARKGKIFEGYRVYRSTDPNGGITSYTLLKQYDIGDYGNPNTGGLHYTFTDSDLVRGNTYWYAVTSYSVPDYSIVSVKNADGTTSVDTSLTEPLESSILANAQKVVLPFSTSDTLGKVIAVPNPYRTDANYTYENGGWEGRTINWNELKRVIKFIHLPQVCTIRIFTITGELVSTIYHGPGAAGYNPNDGEADWHLLSNSNRTVASGIYVFTVSSKLGTQVGKFVIIK